MSNVWLELRVLMPETIRRRVRYMPRLGWIGGLKEALGGNRGMMEGAARKRTKLESS